MQEHYLPAIINKIGQYRSSLLFQPHTYARAKRAALSRKQDWNQQNMRQKVSLLLDRQNAGSDEERKRHKYHHYSRKYCLTEPAEQTVEKITLQISNTKAEILKTKKPAILMPIKPQLHQQKGIFNTLQARQHRYSQQRRSIAFLNQQVRKYTSVCSSHCKSIASIMLPPAPKPNKQQQVQELPIEPWNTSFYPNNRP